MQSTAGPNIRARISETAPASPGLNVSDALPPAGLSHQSGASQGNPASVNSFSARQPLSSREGMSDCSISAVSTPRAAWAEEGNTPQDWLSIASDRLNSAGVEREHPTIVEREGPLELSEQLPDTDEEVLPEEETSTFHFDSLERTRFGRPCTQVPSQVRPSPSVFCCDLLKARRI